MRLILFFILLLSIGSYAFAIEFTVAPLYYVDETTERVYAQNNFQERLLRELGKTETGLELRFKSTGLSRYNPPQSLGDAITICRAEKAGYLIYGFITKKENTIQGELRLLDYEKQEIIASFFAMDSKDREDAFIKDLADKLFRFVQETYNIVIIPDPEVYTHIQFPLSIGYWQPVNKDWITLLFGIVQINGGIQFIPEDIAFVSDGYEHYFSIGLDVSYRLGTGHYYDSWDHGFTASIPFMLHRKLNAQHEIYFGFGLQYSFDVLYVKKPYENPGTEQFTAAGFMICAGWSFRLKEKLFLFADTRIEMRLYDKVMVNIAPSVGVIFRKYSQEVVKKW